MEQRPSDRALIEQTRDRLVSELHDLLGSTTRVALIDFPNHTNSGDSAIWQGERAVLDRLGLEVTYISDVAGYHASRLRDRIGSDGVILCHGGGNFGDYWPRHQNLREAVLKDFPDNRVIQLPQTIGTRDTSNEGRIRDAMSWHKGFTLLCRDTRSLDIATNRLGLDARLVPDGAFGLGPQQRPVPATEDILVLARTDNEQKFDLASIGLPGAVVSDWKLPPRARVQRTFLRVSPRLARSWHHRSGVDRITTPARERSLNAMAKLVVDEALVQLSHYRVVVTDRLHAHVLCALLDIPHVVLDNDYGKVRGVHDTWLADSVTAHFADSVDEARAMALELAK
jgi:exopolysaccharide biosynthesis predicted pyruvyltransferase EpsI